MCEVLDRVEARGKAIGTEIGKAIGTEIGKAIGTESERIANIRSLMENLKWDSKQAMDALNIPAAARAEYEEKLKW